MGSHEDSAPSGAHQLPPDDLIDVLRALGFSEDELACHLLDQDDEQ